VKRFDPKARPKLEKMLSEYLNYVKKWKAEPDNWGGTLNYTSLQILEQAIENAGSLDKGKVKESPGD
jgi:hypothetical protein